jgi:hypothetical protein
MAAAFCVDAVTPGREYPLDRQNLRCLALPVRQDLAAVLHGSLAGIAGDEYYSVGTFLSKKFCPFLVDVDLNSPTLAQASTNILPPQSVLSSGPKAVSTLSQFLPDDLPETSFA